MIHVKIFEIFSQSCGIRKIKHILGLRICSFHIYRLHVIWFRIVYLSNLIFWKRDLLCATEKIKFCLEILELKIKALEWKWYGKTRFTSYEQRLRSNKIKLKRMIWNSKVRVQIHEFKSTSCELKSTNYEYKSTSGKFKSTSSRIIKSMKTQRKKLTN